MYGDGKVTEHPEEAGKMASEVRKNQQEWLARAKAVSRSPQSSARQRQEIAAIGYCFGGSTALELAHSGPTLPPSSASMGLPVPEETTPRRQGEGADLPRGG